MINLMEMTDAWLMACDRNVWQFTAIYNINLAVKHIAGQENIYADICRSRWDKYENISCVEVKYLQSCCFKACADMLYPDFTI